jgi:hypothetical protein
MARHRARLLQENGATGGPSRPAVVKGEDPMKTMLVLAAAAALVLAVPSHAETQTQISIGVQLGNAPPPPVVVYREQPQWVAEPGSVYVINDPSCGYDYFRYGGWYYIYNSGYWYRAHGYRGPFIAVERRYVPGPIFAMDDRHYHWRHRPEYVAEREHRDVPPGWSHGKAKWKDHGDDDDDQGHGHGHH